LENNHFAMIGESYIAKKLDEAKVRYWWNPAQRNYYGADFITEFGVIDVKIANPQIKKYVSTITNKETTRKFWRFNCHHHGTKQTAIDVFVFIVVNCNNENFVYFVMPKEMVKSYTFIISERQIKNGRYNYFINNWDILFFTKDRGVFKENKKFTFAEIAKRVNLPYHRVYGIMTGKICIKPSEKDKIINCVGKSFIKNVKGKGFRITSLSAKTGIPYHRLRRIISGEMIKIHNYEKNILSKILQKPEKELFDITVNNQKQPKQKQTIKKLKLNSKKVKAELQIINRTQTWLAGQMKCSKQNVSEMLRNGSARSAERIGHALGIEPKDLII